MENCKNLIMIKQKIVIEFYSKYIIYLNKI